MQRQPTAQRQRQKAIPPNHQPLPLRYLSVQNPPLPALPNPTQKSNPLQDHTLGIPQFLRGGQTSILASAAGRDFIETNLADHGLYTPIKEPLQPWKVTHWAQAFEKLSWPLRRSSVSSSVFSGSAAAGEIDLGITVLLTPGHTPDELAWYDREERFLYVGDSFYERGGDGMDIIFPAEGNLVEWYFSLKKLRGFVASENSRAGLGEVIGDAGDEDDADEGEWIKVSGRVKVGCGHQTAGVDAEGIMEDLEIMWWRVLRGEVPVVETIIIAGENVDRWMEPSGRGQFSFRAPRRLMVEAREFFAGSGMG